MKTHKLFIWIIGLSLFIIAGCQTARDDEFDDIYNYRTDKILYPQNAKLRQIFTVESVESDKISGYVEEYEYDESGRIDRVSHPMYENGGKTGLLSYDLYKYNDKNLLEKIENYNLNLTEGFINIQNTTYTYDNSGKKIREQIDYPQTGNICKSEDIIYTYDNAHLTEKEYYECDELKSFILYNYNSKGENITEKTYGSDNTPFQIIRHTYRDGLNVKTEYFSAVNNEKTREINRIYDKNDNLVILTSNELMWYSDMSCYVLKYEYDK